MDFRCPSCKIDLLLYDHTAGCPVQEKQLTITQIAAEIATNDYSPELLLQHAMRLLTATATATSGLKHDSAKPMMNLLDAYAMEQLALVLTFGAAKYAPNNWRKGISS